jgi:large subunit ribosomal protein L22
MNRAARPPAKESVIVMPYPAVHRYARIAPRKARLVADMIRGLAVDQAMTALEFSKKRGAWYYRAVLKSALANAEEADADVARLFIRESRVDEGPTIKRFQPKDRGRAHPIMKRTSHLHIVLDERT